MNQTTQQTLESAQQENLEVPPLAPSSPGANVLLMGETGSGKTYCIRTLIECGITPFVIATEPGIADTLGDIPPDQLHWHYVAPAMVPWSALIETATKINTLSSSRPQPRSTPCPSRPCLKPVVCPSRSTHSSSNSSTPATTLPVIELVRHSVM